VIVASAGGRIVAVAAETPARSITASQGAPLVVTDVRPLTAGDEIGVGVFLFMIVCTVCGYLAVTLLLTVAPGQEPGRRYPIIAAIAVLVPVIGGLGVGTDLLRLLAWTGVVVALLVLPVFRKLARRREHSSTTAGSSRSSPESPATERRAARVGSGGPVSSTRGAGAIRRSVN
jgi:hypothetical protein